MDAIGLAEQIRAGSTSALEQALASVERIETTDPDLNAVVHRRFERAIAEAGAMTDLPPSPLAGVPCLVKNLGLDVEGLELTHGSASFAGNVPTADSELTRRYRAAGLIILGSTNSPEFGMSATTEPTSYGATRNPWALDRSTSGSSGGSAAAVAAGLVTIAHGNDGGGSIRIPAATCGVVGLKPSRGRVPNRPHSGGFGRPFTTNHVLTRSIRDTAAVLDLTRGPAHGDLLAEPNGQSFLDAAVRIDGGRLRIGVFTTTPDGLDADRDQAAGVSLTAERCAQLGHEVSAISSPFVANHTLEVHRTVQFAILRQTVALREAHLDRELRHDELESTTWEMLDAAAGIDGRQVVEALNACEELAWSIADHTCDFDVLLCPVTPRQAPLLETIDDFAYHSFTAVWNLTGQPALAIPTGLTSEGLPVGAQFIAPLGNERELLQIGGEIERAWPWEPALAEIPGAAH